jgi:hypothetical protein
MNEQCPLGELAAEEEIPEYCRKICGDTWRLAEVTRPPITEVLDPLCSHETVNSGEERLRRWQGSDDMIEYTRAVRYYAVVSACIETGREVLAEVFRFDCQNNM